MYTKTNTIKPGITIFPSLDNNPKPSDIPGQMAGFSSTA